MRLKNVFRCVPRFTLLRLRNALIGVIQLFHDTKFLPARFYGPALYPLNVRVLKFIDTPLKFIEEHSFLGVNRTLQELHVIGGVLEKFPKEALQILGNLTVLTIRGHKLNELSSNIFVESFAASKIERFEISNGNVYHFPS